MEFICIEVQRLRLAIVHSSSRGIQSLALPATFGLSPKFFCHEICTRLPENPKLVAQLMSDPLKNLDRVVSVHS